MKVMFKLCLMSTAVAFLSGCAVIQYEHPTTEDAAKLTFANASGGTLVVDGYVDSKLCQGLLNLSEKSKRWVNLSDSPTEEVTLRPNEELSFSFSYARHPNTCRLVGTFTPRERGRYTATFSADHDSCYMTMTVIENGRQVVEKSFRGRKTKTKIFASNDLECLPETPKESAR
jgi:hypothetical protein